MGQMPFPESSLLRPPPPWSNLTKFLPAYSSQHLGGVLGAVYAETGGRGGGREVGTLFPTCIGVPKSVLPKP